ncbi:2-hydroxy-6-oxononadienedioate/2-hydroxy-6-oxononatrienedioate hydrolase [Impatiens glandulifera]|uniref:2-hydroxy-6-oxononadienedioate/2-hydroxy-6- oxononatrienedioate hydrolase n=1 Tax=Impatiens glandulifera TaxID=253017 RepID=UPI001FB0766A|nr:2-hydroxy-6-oxononadienedioate/2-hydroxy-6-oxononatrienedioate hydrolase [Impatiens glandulifera]
MTTYSCLSLVSLYEGYLRRGFAGAGLSRKTIDIDVETTMEYWGPTNTIAPKPALVMIHGFGPETIWQWQRQVMFFRREFDLYFPNLVFFGNSTTNSRRRSEIFQAECVVKLMEKLGVQKFSIMGTSYGGFVSYMIASQWPEKIEKVVISSSGVNMRLKDNINVMKKAKVESIEEILLPTTVPRLRTMLSLVSVAKIHVPNFILKELINKLFLQNRKEKIELLRGSTIGKDDTVNVSPIRQEVLIVWGDKDNIFSLDLAHELKELLGEKARIEVIKNTSHIPQIENPQAFNNIVYQFLHAI